MAYTDPFLRLVVSGSLYTAEDFSWSITLLSDFPTPGPPPDAVPAGVISAVEAFHQSACYNSARLELVKLNQIGVDGLYVNKNETVLHEYIPTVPGGQSGTIPPQIACAVTLDTGASRGLASRGRFYVPIPRYGVSTDGRMTVADAQALANLAGTLVNSLNSAVEGYRVGVASNVREGAERFVTGVRVGRVLDTIRSRRTSLPEDHVSSTVAITA